LLEFCFCGFKRTACKKKEPVQTGSPDGEITYASIPGAQKRSEANFLLTAPPSFAAEQDLSANPLQMAHLLSLI
jgi:hypothetical protein